MSKRAVAIFTFVCLTLIGCSNYTQNFPPSFRTELPPISQPTERNNTCPAFNTVNIRGPFIVTVHYDTNPANAQLANIRITGDTAYVNAVIYVVQKNTVTAYMDPHYSYPPGMRVHIDLTVPDLARLYYKGPGQVTLTQIYSPHLRLIGDGYATFVLDGYLQRFDATLTGHAKLNAKCLFTKMIFINTTDHAQAEILNNGGGIGALATDESNIYYYAEPDMVAPYTRESGSIMRMRGIAEPFIIKEQPTISANQILDGRG